MRAFALATLVLLAILAGCTTQEAAPKDVVGTTEPGLPLALVHGHVMTEDELPIPGANVTASGPRNESVDSDANGEYQFVLPLGHYALTITHPLYESRTIHFQLAEDYHPTTKLVPLGASLPFNHTFDWTGHYDCAVEAVILTGDCLVAYQRADPAGDPVTNETNYVFYDVDANWTQVVVELFWTPGGQNQLDGMHLYVAAGNESKNPADHHTKYAIAEGGQDRLRVDLFSGQAHATAEKWTGTNTKAQLPAEGGPLMLIVYPRGKLANEIGKVCDPTDPSRCFLGVGAALDLDFTVWITVFYNGPAPEGYSALA